MQPPTPPSGVVSLEQLFPRASFHGGNPTLRGCSSDWRSIRQGDLFVAVVDDDADGHETARQAVQRGAAAVIAERPLQLTVPVCVVPDTREALGRACQTLAGRPADQLVTIGVSGTSGKTVTSELIASILRAAGHRTGSLTTLGHHDGDQLKPTDITLPTPERIARILKQAVDNGCSHAVLEVSSEALAKRTTSGLDWDVAVLTNVRRDHLDLHGTLPNYQRAKARLFQQLAPRGCAILNLDDVTSRNLLPTIDHPALTTGIQTDAQIGACLIEQFPSEQTFILTAGNESVPVRTSIIGSPHVTNCLAAAGAGLSVGIDLPTIARGLEAVPALPGRLERVECGQEFSLFVDRADTADQLAATLRALRSVIPGRLICVYGARASHSRTVRAELGSVVERLADLEVITNDNPGIQPHFQIVHDILDGYRRPAKARVMPSRGNAITWALQQAQRGDCVLIAGKGDRCGQQLSGGWMPWDDREYARSQLYAAAAPSERPPRLLPFRAPTHLN